MLILSNIWSLLTLVKFCRILCVVLRYITALINQP